MEEKPQLSGETQARISRLAQRHNLSPDMLVGLALRTWEEKAGSPTYLSIKDPHGDGCEQPEGSRRGSQRPGHATGAG